jgi:hypothetical protein
MYTALQQAATQEAAYKTAVEELNRTVAALKLQQTTHKDLQPKGESPLDQAHSAFESLISAEWGPAASLSSISEANDTNDALSPSASPRAVRGQGHPFLPVSKGSTR